MEATYGVNPLDFPPFASVPRLFDSVGVPWRKGDSQPRLCRRGRHFVVVGLPGPGFTIFHARAGVILHSCRKLAPDRDLDGCEGTLTGLKLTTKDPELQGLHILKTTGSKLKISILCNTG